ncbi:hypothetical protein XELAEV_18006370mg [Xenopus laevis]|uniref:Uncharacterized protein n=1 Tax=Xenopus laevis TaxID=8355 RepID=A0A974I493_XENLA|nr:hypothetical protein XELAEV_18006370mg [Xenopus laevis]
MAALDTIYLKRNPHLKFYCVVSIIRGILYVLKFAFIYFFLLKQSQSNSHSTNIVWYEITSQQNCASIPIV